MSKTTFKGATYTGIAEAFTIFAKYGKPGIADMETNYEGITVIIKPTKLEDDDYQRLKELGWVANNGYGYFSLQVH